MVSDSGLWCKKRRKQHPFVVSGVHFPRLNEHSGRRTGEPRIEPRQPPLAAGAPETCSAQRLFSLQQPPQARSYILLTFCYNRRAAAAPAALELLPAARTAWAPPLAPGAPYTRVRMPLCPNTHVSEYQYRGGGVQFDLSSADSESDSKSDTKSYSK